MCCFCFATTLVRGLAVLAILATISTSASRLIADSKRAASLVAEMPSACTQVIDRILVLSVIYYTVADPGGVTRLPRNPPFRQRYKSGLL